LKLLKYFLFAFLSIFLAGCDVNKNDLTKKNEHIPLTSKKAIKLKIINEARKQGLSPILALSVAKQESNFEKTAKSYVGAVGVFQLMPATAKDLGVNPWYPEQNIEGGIKYLKALKSQFGSTKLALAAYNAGPGTVNKYNGIPPYDETRTYVKNILNYYNHYSKNPETVMVE
jgi:soluble lytic murein transglycosylase-like protein